MATLVLTKGQGVTQALEHLPSQCETVGSNPNCQNENKKQNKTKNSRKQKPFGKQYPFGQHLDSLLL
jgi:hypothetical protein